MLLVTSCCHKGSVQACCRLVQLRVLQTDPTHSATYPDVMPAAALACPPTSTRPAHPLAHTHVFCISHYLTPCASSLPASWSSSSRLALYLPLQQGVVLSPGMPGRDLIARTKLKVSLDSRWGDISLVEATLLGLEEVLRRCPHVAHIGLSSGHDVPVQLIR